MRDRLLTTSCMVPVIALVTLFAAPALAQAPAAVTDAAAAAAGQGDVTDTGEILVTARRATERLQDVPLSITAQTGEQLKELNISDLEGIARITPSLQFKDFVTTFHGNATIRGLSQINTSNAVGNVGVFINGVYLQRGYMVDTSLGDFARVEVVKGPQSALYGQNTFSGAINYVTVEPSDTFKGSADATVGNHQLRTVSGAIGGPLVPGLLDFRVYVGHSEYNGSWRNKLASINPAAAGHLDRFGGYNRDAFSGALKLTPIDGLKIGGFYSQNRRREQLRPYYAIDGTIPEDKTNCGPVNATTGRPSLFCGTFPINPSAYRSGIGNPRVDTPFSVEQPDTLTRTQVARATVDYDITDALHFAYVYGWTNGKAQEDLGAASNTYNQTIRPTVSQQHEGGRLTYDSHEARVAYDNHGMFSAEAGYFHSGTLDRFLFGTRTATVGAPFPRLSNDPLTVYTGLLALTRTEARYTVDSGFGRVTGKFLDDTIVVTAEGRETNTSISFNDLLARSRNPALPLLEAKFKAFTPRFTAEYHPTRASMVYASAAKGVKAGGFNGYVSGNVTLLPEEQSFGQEENWTYEVGSKNSFMGGNLIVNATLFYVDWTKKQTSRTPSNYVPTTLLPGTIPANIYTVNGNATSYGLELDGLWRPVPKLTFTYSAALMNPRYGKNTIAANFIGLCTVDNCPVNGSTSKNQIERTSKFAGSGGLEWNDALTSSIDYFAGVNASYQSKQYGDPVNASKIAGYTLVDGRIGVSGTNWKAWIWGQNLFDKKYISGVFVTTATRVNQVSFGERRTFGLSVSTNF